MWELGAMFGKRGWRSIVRFATFQSRRWKMIDDGKRSFHNIAQFHIEHIHRSPVDFLPALCIALVAMFPSVIPERAIQKTYVMRIEAAQCQMPLPSGALFCSFTTTSIGGEER